MNIAEERGRQASIDGFAHEHIVVGLLMKRYQNVSLVDLPLSTYDIIIVKKDETGSDDIIRAQVKTATASVSFIGGSRGGADRTYKSGVKTYRQSPETSDVIIGVHPINDNSFGLYFIPTVLVEHLNQNSISINKIRALKDNYFILENCKNSELIIQKCQEYGILQKREQYRLL
jgi:hypothetical protein